jgi:hypothetical protein
MHAAMLELPQNNMMDLKLMGKKGGASHQLLAGSGLSLEMGFGSTSIWVGMGVMQWQGLRGVCVHR